MEATDLRKTTGSREFAKQYGDTRIVARVTADRGDVVVYVHSRSGYGGSSRRVSLGQVTDEVLNLMASDETGVVLADALQECGLDDGACSVIRGN